MTTTCVTPEPPRKRRFIVEVFEVVLATYQVESGSFEGAAEIALGTDSDPSGGLEYVKTLGVKNVMEMQ